MLFNDYLIEFFKKNNPNYNSDELYRKAMNYLSRNNYSLYQEWIIDFLKKENLIEIARNEYNNIKGLI